MPILRP
ncbi:hypothetical protein YPPY52_2150, partial [Yersinia pestis PY-52]